MRSGPGASPASICGSRAANDGRRIEAARYSRGHAPLANRLVFNQPAGHVEAHETLLQAVVREAREETAWRFIPRALLGAYRWHRARSRRITLRFAFIGEVVDHDVGQRLDRGIVRTHWLTRDDLLQREPLLRSPLVLRCIDDYLGGRRLPLEPVASLDLHTAASTSAEIV